MTGSSTRPSIAVVPFSPFLVRLAVELKKDGPRKPVAFLKGVLEAARGQRTCPLPAPLPAMPIEYAPRYAHKAAVHIVDMAPCRVVLLRQGVVSPSLLASFLP